MKIIVILWLVSSINGAHIVETHEFTGDKAIATCERMAERMNSKRDTSKTKFACEIAYVDE